MPFQGPYNTDWIYATASNAHAANHRDWFFNYTPLGSRTSAPDGSGMEVVGIGDVQLEVNMKTSTSEGAYNSLILRDVLHIPSAVANVVAAPILEEFTTCSFGGGGAISNPSTGVTLLLDKPKFYKLWLVGQARGQTSLDEQGDYWINVNWSASERARWERKKRDNEAKSLQNGHKRSKSKAAPNTLNANQNSQEEAPAATGKSKKRNKKKGEDKAASTNGVQAELQPAQESWDEQVEQDKTMARAQQEEEPQQEQTATKAPRHSPEEKAWLKAHYGNEYKFLRSQGLKIFKNQDRQKGEEIMRGMMAADGMNGATLDSTVSEPNGVAV